MLQGFFDASRHLDANCTIFAVPIDSQCAVVLGFPIDCAFVFFRNACEQVLGMFFSHTFDKEIICHEAECNWSQFVAKKSRDCVSRGGVPISPIVVGAHCLLV